MILDAVRSKEEDTVPAVTVPLLLVQGLATSIDALAIGVSVSFLAVDIVFFAFFNCLITLAICVIGCLIGRSLGRLLGKKAAIIGGLVLIIIGVKIFIEGLS
jgi:putative Mn2+ efflux pump MntP